MPAELATISQTSQDWRTSCGVAAYSHRFTIVRGRRRVTLPAAPFCNTPLRACISHRRRKSHAAHDWTQTDGVSRKALFGRCVWSSSRYCRMSAGARVHVAIEGALTTKLTTCGLDVLGRVWTLRRVLQNRRLQVRFLSHLPSRTLEMKRLPAHELRSRFQVFQANDAQCDANYKSP